MKRVMLLLVGCTAAAGCRTTDPAVAMLETELRWLEDQYYVLEEQYNRKCQQLESCRLAHAAAAADGEPIPPGAPLRPEPDSRRRRRDPPPVEAPPVEPPRVRGLPEDAFDLTPEPNLAPVEPSSFHQPLDTHVTHIVLNRQLTGGYSRDGHAGDDGVLVVIEPRNRGGEFVPLSGDVSVRLIDPAAAEDERLVAQWRLSAHEAAVKMRCSLLGRGLHLELPWPVEPPRRPELKLEVEYTTVDKRNLRAERDVTIHLPRSLSARWTPITPEGPPSALPRLQRTETAERASPPAAAPPSWSPQR